MLMDRLLSKTPTDYDNVNSTGFPVVAPRKNRNIYLGFAVVGGNTGLGIYNTEDLTYSGVFYQSSEYNEVAISEDGSKFVVAFQGADYGLTLVDSADGTVIAETSIYTGTIVNPQFAVNDQYIVAFFNQDSTVKILDATDLSEVFSFDAADCPTDGVVGVASNNGLYALNNWDYDLYMYDIESQTLLWNKAGDFTEGIYAESMNFNHDGSKIMILTGGGEDNHAILDTTDGTVINGSIPNSTVSGENEYFSEAVSVYFHENERYAFIASPENSDVYHFRIVDVENNTLVYEEEANGYFAFIGVTSRADKAAVYVNDGTTKFIASLMPTDGNLFLTDNDGIALNDNGDYLINNYDIGTVYQTIPSDIFEMSIVNDTSLTLSELIVDSPEDLTFGTSADNFEDVETLTLNSGPYNPGDVVTIYCKAKVGTDVALGQSSISVTVQGNE